MTLEMAAVGPCTPHTLGAHKAHMLAWLWVHLPKAAEAHDEPPSAHRMSNLQPLGGHREGHALSQGTPSPRMVACASTLCQRDGPR